jgi:DNA mismatch repair protein MutS2
VLPTGSTELAEALERLEQERTGLKEQMERLIDRERVLLERESEALRTTARDRARLASERSELRESGTRLIEDLRREGSEVIAELRSQNKTRHDLSRVLATASARLNETTPSNATQAPESTEPLRTGDQVELGNLRGELLAIEPGKAVFGRGGLRIEVAPERLRRVSRALTVSTPTVAVSSARDVSSEINLVGERTGEALRKLEDFLDQAYLTNQPEVRVIHGIGSGALKKAIHDYLASSPYTSAFRQAEPHQGGAGATIVKIGD